MVILASYYFGFSCFELYDLRYSLEARKQEVRGFWLYRRTGKFFLQILDGCVAQSSQSFPSCKEFSWINVSSLYLNDMLLRNHTGHDFIPFDMLANIVYSSFFTFPWESEPCHCGFNRCRWFLVVDLLVYFIINHLLTYVCFFCWVALVI